MIDINSEELVAIPDTPAEMPNRPHIATVWRWIKRGCRGVKLETVLVGGRRYTSRESIFRFVEATTEAADSGSATSPNLSPSRRRAHENANRELDDAGI